MIEECSAAKKSSVTIGHTKLATRFQIGYRVVEPSRTQRQSSTHDLSSCPFTINLIAKLKHGHRDRSQFVILLTEPSLQSLYDKLNNWSSPHLVPCSFASTAQARSSTEPLSVDELDLVLSELSRKLDFEGSLIPGKQFAREWPIQPIEDDFETLDDFELALEAYEELWPNVYDPKPWLMPNGDSDVERELLDAMAWTINNKSYELVNEDGEVSHVAFSHQPDEARMIVEQKYRHQELVKKFAQDASKLFAGDGVSLYRSNHQLDTDMDESIAGCYEGCFFDQTLAFVSAEHMLMIWVGHLRWYG